MRSGRHAPDTAADVFVCMRVCVSVYLEYIRTCVPNRFRFAPATTQRRIYGPYRSASCGRFIIGNTPPHKPFHQHITDSWWPKAINTHTHTASHHKKKHCSRDKYSRKTTCFLVVEICRTFLASFLFVYVEPLNTVCVVYRIKYSL